MGVGSSNRKNQWQARILVHGKVTHLGYYETEEDAARVYDRVSISLHGSAAQTNFSAGDYQEQDQKEYAGLDREDLQRALGVKPMDKSSKSALPSFLHFASPLLPLPALGTAVPALHIHSVLLTSGVASWSPHVSCLSRHVAVHLITNNTCMSTYALQVIFTCSK